MDNIKTFISKWGRQKDGSSGLQNIISEVKQEIDEQLYDDVIDELKLLGIEIEK